MSGTGCQPAESGGPGAGEGSLCEEGTARPSQWVGGGSRSGLMSKSMPFLGASIFFKGNWLSEGGFPVPSESQPEKGVCTNRSCDWERGGTLVWWLDLQPVAVESELGVSGAPRFLSPSPAVRPAPHTWLWLRSYTQKGALSR